MQVSHRTQASENPGMFLRTSCLFLVAMATLLSHSVAFASNHYVRASSTGNGSGSDWTNACADFTGSCAVASLVRGDTYYIAAGPGYAAQNWNKAASGTLPITIRRATVADHGTDTGWDNAFDGRVIWGYGHTVSTGFWIFDGVSAGNMTDGTSYGFYFNHGSNCSNDQKIVSIGATDVTFRYLAMDMCAPSFDFAKWCFEITPGANNTVISHAYCVNSIDFIQTNGDQAQRNATYEYVYTKNNGGSATNHGEVYQLVCNGCTIRYNYFADCSSTSCISGNAGTAPGAPNLIPLFNTKIYGNIFNHVDAGNGVIHAAGSTGIAGTLFYNNTIVNQTTGPFFDECSGHTCPSGSGNNVVQNNLIWNGNCSLGQLGLSGDSHDYNTFLSCAGSPPSEPNRQTGNYNPFVSSATNDFHLASYSPGACSSTTTLCAGTPLPSPYDVDPDGNTRGGDGVWDRGAYEFGGAQANRPAPPQGLAVSVR